LPPSLLHLAQYLLLSNFNILVMFIGNPLRLVLKFVLVFLFKDYFVWYSFLCVYFSELEYGICIAEWSLMALGESPLVTGQRPRYECLLLGGYTSFSFLFTEFALVNGYQTTSVCIFFWLQSAVLDLDDTLYPLSSGLAAACTNNIEGNFVAVKR
jgi:hypothetical protein